MKLCVLKERRSGESRVAATPETVKKLKALGYDVVIEKGAGESSSYSDDAYQEAGAKIAKDYKEALQGADIIAKIQRPLQKGEDKIDEGAYLPEKTLLLAAMNPYQDKKQFDFYQKAGVSAVALELVPRITRAQSMDILSSQTNLAGYRAVIEACEQFDRVFPMMMTAAGTVPPAKVLIVGAGVAGLQAIATAKRLGARVSAFDVRAAAREQVESLGATFIEVESDESGEGTGGYAKEMSEAYKKRQEEKLAKSVSDSDIVITTALIPGKPAPRLLTKDMVQAMKPGSVVVDMAVASGGNVEGSKPDETVETGGVKIIGYTNLAGRVARDASALFARNVLNFIQLVTDQEKKALKIDLSDEIIKGCLVTHEGKIIHPNFQ